MYYDIIILVVDMVIIMGVYCYADNFSCLFQTLSGLKEMLKLCIETYNYFNGFKIHLLYFSSLTASLPKDFIFKMKEWEDHNIF